MDIHVDPDTFARINRASHKMLIVVHCEPGSEDLVPYDATLRDGWNRSLPIKVLHHAPYRSQDLDPDLNPEYAANFFKNYTEARDPMSKQVLTIMKTGLQ